MHATQLDVLGDYASNLVQLHTTDGGFELPSRAYRAKGEHHRPCEGWKNIGMMGIVTVLQAMEPSRIEDTDQLHIRAC